MNSAEVLIKFKGDTKDAETKIAGLTKSFTLGTLAAKGITKAISSFTANLDSAINRVDTLNNFPRVMSNLGISAEDSAEVIKDLSDKLQGLPTTINDAAAAVQRFTSKNGDVKQSEKLFLAVNNAILAGGSSSAIQSSALEQLSQAYAKGKPDMMEWRTLMTAMPAQLKQVATAMGYVDAAMLGEAVRADGGEKEFARMMDTMMRMNTEGVNGFKSFDEQARNATGGISTSITNMKTAFVRGVADMINKVNEALEPFGGLSGVLKSIGKFGEQAFKKIGEVLVWVIPKVIKIFQFIASHKKELILIGSIVAGWKIASYVQKGVQAFQHMKIMLSLLKLEMGTTSAASAVLKYGINGLKTGMAALNAVIKANPITILVGLIMALVAAFIYLWNNCEGFRNFFIGLWQGIIAGVQAVWTFLQTIFQIIVGAVTTFIQTIWTFISPIFDFIKNALYLIIAVVAIVLETIYNILIGVAGWVWDNVLNPIVSFFTTAFDFVTGIVGNAVNFITGVFSGIANWIWNNVLSPVVNFFTSAFNTVRNAVVSVFNAIRDTISNIFNAIGNIIKVPINGIISGINGVLKTLNKIKIPDWVPGLGGKGVNFKMIPKLATGTNYVPDDTLAMIHKGEAVIPKKFNPYANGSFTGLIGSMQSKNTQPIINVYADVSTDPLGQTVSQIKTFSGGAKNDYNYGMGAI